MSEKEGKMMMMKMKMPPPNFVLEVPMASISHFGGEIKPKEEENIDGGAWPIKMGNKRGIVMEISMKKEELR